LTDPERLAAGELVYTGVRRTPVSALVGQSTVAELGHAVAAELFATVHDVHLVLGWASEEAHDCDTADGRPATKAHAHARLARMSCADVERFSLGRARRLAREIFCFQRTIVEAALKKVAARLPQPPRTIVLAGIGDRLAGAALRCLPRGFRVIALRKKLSPSVSAAACAYALAVLAKESW
jgi:probable H4MPT-linked C1 transfer pathway protein